MCAQNEENKKKIGNRELRGGGGGSGDPQKKGIKDCEAGIHGGSSGDGDDSYIRNKEQADDLRKGDCGLTEVVVVVPKKQKDSIPETPSSGDSTSTTFVDEDQPLSKEEKRIHYKFSKNVMAGRKIRELMNANVRENLRLRMQETQPKSFKFCFVAGVAIAIQIFVLILIFI